MIPAKVSATYRRWPIAMMISQITLRNATTPYVLMVSPSMPYGMVSHPMPALDACGYAAAGRTCASDGACTRPEASTKRRSNRVRLARPNIWRLSRFRRVI
jgi:hypothetical protein